MGKCQDAAVECNYMGFLSWSVCHDIEYVGWVHGDNYDCRRFYSIPYCDEPMLNRVVMGGKVMWACGLMFADEEDEAIEMMFELRKGERKAVLMTHNTIDTDI